MGLREHGARMRVLIQAAKRFVVEAEVTRQQGLPVGPDQANEIDPQHDPVVFPTPVPGHPRHVLGIGLVQRAVIQDQGAGLAPDQRFHFLPKRRRVRRLSREQARESVMSRWVDLLGLAQSRFRAGKDTLGGDQKLN